jgi:hypothetical protein
VGVSGVECGVSGCSYGVYLDKVSSECKSARVTSQWPAAAQTS